jgi:hypothetical protein
MKAPIYRYPNPADSYFKSAHSSIIADQAEAFETSGAEPTKPLNYPKAEHIASTVKDLACFRDELIASYIGDMSGEEEEAGGVRGLV